MEAKDLLVLNKRAMRKLFKYKLFSPFLTVSVGQNTTRTKRSTSASPTFNEHLTLYVLPCALAYVGEQNS
jgi:hypothetical protein